MYTYYSLSDENNYSKNVSLVAKFADVKSLENLQK